GGAVRHRLLQRRRRHPARPGVVEDARDDDERRDRPLGERHVHGARRQGAGRGAKVAINGDGNQQIAIGYLNAAGIPDSPANPWPTTSPDILTPAQVAGPTTTNHCDGALFDSQCIPVYCQFMSMHWDVNAAAMSPETVWETRTFLTNPTH